MTGENAQQIADWNGATGEKWAADQERTDRLIRAYGEAALAAGKPAAGEHVLDVGCGCGDTSLALAAAVGASGRVVGLDVSSPMLAVARRRAAGAGNLTFAEGDASQAELDGPFDLLFSRFGVMFFDNPPAAFRHMRGGLKPGGRLAFVCWRAAMDNPWAALPAQTARKAAAIEMAPPDPTAPGPFAFGDRDRVADILASAGFSRTDIAPFEAPMYLGSSARSAAEAAVRIGPASRVAREAPADRLPAIIDAIEAALTPLAGEDGSVSLPGRAWIVTAESPG